MGMISVPVACLRVWGLTQMCSGSEAGSYLRLIDFVYHSTLGLRVIKKKKKSMRVAPAGRVPVMGMMSIPVTCFGVYGLGFRIQGAGRRV